LFQVFTESPVVQSFFIGVHGFRLFIGLRPW